jgi:hypothetical protein
MVEIESNDVHFLEVLKHSLAAFIQEIQRHGFRPPIEVKVLDCRWKPIQLFTVETTGKFTRLHQPERGKTFIFPLKILGKDARQRIARVEIGANNYAREVQYLN